MPQEQEHNAASWSQDGHDDLMNPGVGDVDFSSYLDLDDAGLHFTDLEDYPSGLDTPMGRLAFSQHAGIDTLGYSNPPSLDIDPMSTQNNFQPQLLTDQHFQPSSQYPQVQWGHTYNVPPTPVSLEMQAAKYGPQVDSTGHMFSIQRQQASFTPLVSPAQTPIHGAFTMPEYGTADDFFSPLTSPALEAQNQHTSASSTASPADMIAEKVIKSSSAPRRGGRKTSVSTKTQSRSVKQSPVARPMTRRRQASMNNTPSDQIETLLNKPKVNRTLRPHVPGNNTRSSEDSVSPEALTEALMRPPPVPQSTDRSPRPLVHSQTTDAGDRVTPATLMRLPSKQGSPQNSQQPNLPGLDLEDIMLPDAAAPPTQNSLLLSVDTSMIPEEDESTPTLSAKSAKLSASSTPRGAVAKNNSQDGFVKPEKADNRGGRGGKKRQSTNTATISPALRPKISPITSPLAPAASPGVPQFSAETNALYLASKSNYQNIIDGTHLPGVSYPEALAENLSSKRTSHKIAEQGRRNRINLALKEIEVMLPPAISGAGSKRERAASVADEVGDKGASSAAGASKASTVEMAIVYIKSLQAELEVTKTKLDAAEKKLAASTSSAGSQASD